MKADGAYNNLKRGDALTEADLDVPYENYKGFKVTLRD